MIPKLDTKLSESEKQEIMIFTMEFLHNPKPPLTKGKIGISRDMFMPVLMKHMVSLYKEEFKHWHDNMLKEDHLWLREAIAAVDLIFKRYFDRQDEDE